MSQKEYDPFDAWRRFQDEQPARQKKNILREDLKIEKLHDPDDYLKEVGEFIQETSAHVKALLDFSHHHEVPRTNPTFGDALDSVAEALDRLKKELAHVKLPPAPMEKESAPAGGSYGGGALFKK
jgi:hypothetical protein